MPNKRYDNVQLTVTFGDTLKNRNQNISSGENIAQSLGKISTWYDSLVPTGGSSGQFLGWNSDGTAKWVSNPNSDTKVTDTVGTANTYYPAGLTGTTTTTGTQVFDTSFKFIGTTGTTSAVGKAQLVLGNSTVSGTANNKQGSIVVYGSTAYAHTIQGAPTAARTLTLPDKTGTFALTSDINDAALTLKGAGTAVTTFTANASSAKSLDIVAGSNVTVTADATNAKISIASSHPSITKSTDTTSTASPAHGGTFTVVDSITREANGHVTKINTKTVTLPADSNTDTLVSQTFASADHNRPLLMSYYDTGVQTTTAQIVHRNDALFFNPSSGILRSPRLYLQTTGMPITINLDTLQPTAGENVNVLAVRYKNADGTATHTVYPIGILGNDATGSSANYNSGVRLGSTNGTTIVGAGESSVTFAEAQAKYNDENLYFVADQAVYMYTNCSNDSTTVTGPWRVGGFTTGTATITSGRVMITDGTTGGFKASDYTIAKSVPSDAKFSDTVTTVTTSGSGNAVTSITASNGALTVTKGSTFSLSNHTHTTTIAADSGTSQLTLAASTKYKLTTGGTNFIFTTPPNTTYSAGTGLSLSGTTFNHSNSVTARTNYNAPHVKYDAQGHITASSYWVHTATGTNNKAGWIKIATMKHTTTYDNTPIMLTISQRGNTITYRLHIQFSNSNTTDPPLSKFIISSDEAWQSITPRAYIIKSDTSTWDLYIQKKDNYEALVVTRFDVGKYFTDHITWTWTDVQIDTDPTGGTEATKKVYSTTDHTHNYAGSSSAGGAATSANKLNTDAGGTYLPVYFSSGVPVAVTVKNNTSVGTIGWTSGAAGNAALVTVNSIAYWNGAYSGTSSNLTYCVKGTFGSIVTKNTDDYYSATATRTANTVLAAPNGSNGAATFRKLVAADIPDLSGTYLPLSGGTMTGQIKTSFKESVAVGSYQAQATKIPDLCTELRYSSGAMGSVALTEAYTKDGITIAATWYNFIWIPHRSGGVNGAASGDNCNFGSLILSGMTGSGAFIIRYASGSIAELKYLYKDTTYSANNGVGLSGTTFYNSGVRAVSAGSANGTISVNTNGTTGDVAVKGLGSAAYTESSDYATSSHTHGLSHSNLNQSASNVTTDAWATVGIDPTVKGYVLKSIRYQTNVPPWGPPSYGVGIAFGGQDTKALINIAYDSPNITFVGGNHNSSKTAPTWYIKLTGTTTSTYNLDNFYVTTTSRTANTVLAAPNGSNGAATFRKLVAADIPDLSGSYLPLSGGTLTGELTFASFANATADADRHIFFKHNTANKICTNDNFKYNPAKKRLYCTVVSRTLTGGTAVAGQDKGSGVSPRYFPAKWKFNAGLTPADGDTIIIKLPGAGHASGVWLSVNNGTTYYPISNNNKTRLQTQFASGQYIELMFKSDGKTTTYPMTGANATSDLPSSGGCWVVLNYYDSNSDTKVTQNITSGSAKRPLLMSYYQTGTTTTSAQVVYRNDSIYANPSTGTIHATTFDGNITTDAFHNAIYALGTTSDTATFDGAETLITSLPSASGTSTPSYKRTTLNNFIKNVIGNLKEPVLYENTSTPSKSATVRFDTTLGMPKYLKLFIVVCGSTEYTTSSSVTNIVDIDPSAVDNGCFVSGGSPGQSGVSTFLTAVCIRHTVSSVNHTYGIIPGSSIGLQPGSTPSHILQSLWLTKIIAVY